MSNYTDDLPTYGDLMTVAEFVATCAWGGFIDSDGSGHLVKDGKMDPKYVVYPSQLRSIPKDATHIMWFNK